MLRGSYSARIDDKGRLKIPNAFKAFVENQHGAKGVYVTSLSGNSVRIYPMSVWMAVEDRLSKMASTHPARVKFLDRVNFYGQVTEFDAQGRVLIPARLRDAAGAENLRLCARLDKQGDPDAAVEARLEQTGLGDRREVIPAHCCATMNLHRTCLGVRKGAVEAVWPIEASGRYD